MDFVPSRDQGHLIVAAIRVETHRRNKPPTPEEVAELLGFSREIVLHLIRGLEARGILRSIESPFDVRIDIADYALVEALPVESQGPDMGREIEDFHKRSEDRQKRIEQMLRDGDPERLNREKVSRMEEEFRRFRKKKPPGSLFRDPPG